MDTVYKPPYQVRASAEYLESRTTKDVHGKDYNYNLRYCNAQVYHIDGDKETKIFEYKQFIGKGSRMIFAPFKHNNKWYGIKSETHTLVIYSLPDMNEISRVSVGLNVYDVYIPRVLKGVIPSKDPTKSDYPVARIDEEIEEDSWGDPAYKFESDWQHANFAFIIATDPYSSCPMLLKLLDLSTISEGSVEFKSKKWITIIDDYKDPRECIVLDSIDGFLDTITIKTQCRLDLRTGEVGSVIF